MKLIKTTTSKKLSDLSDKVPDILNEIMSVFINLTTLKDTLNDTENPTQGDDILSELENFEDKNQIKYFTLFAQLCCSKDILSCKRAKSALEELNSIFDFANNALVKYIPLSEEEMSDLLKFTERGIGHITLFLKQQFDLENTLASLNTSDEAVDVSFFDYVQKAHNGTLKNTIENILHYSMVCKPPLKVFEEYPELEAEFLAIVGNTEDFEIFEEYLTKDILDRVLTCQTLAEVDQVLEELKAYAKGCQVKPSNAFGA